VILLAGQAAPVLFDAVAARFEGMDGENILGSVVPVLATVFGLLLGVVALIAVGVGSVVLCLLGLLALPRRLGNSMRTLAAAVLPRREAPVRAGYRRSVFGRAVHLVVGNPVMPLVACGAIFVLVGSVLMFYISNNNGTEFFVENDRSRRSSMCVGGQPVARSKGRACPAGRGCRARASRDRDGVRLCGRGRLDNNTGGAQPPRDTIGQVQFETIPWEDRPRSKETWFTLPWLDVGGPARRGDPGL